MTDSMNFGPDWIRNLSSDGNAAGGTGGGTRCQLADYRYGREEMLSLFDRNIKPPACLTNFKSLYSEMALPPLALLPVTDEERNNWPARQAALGGPPRGRGGSLERGGRGTRGRGGYQTFTRPANYENWGNGEPSDWSPRKEYNSRPASMDNWRRARNNEEDDGWRMSAGRGAHDKWGRSTSWRGEVEGEERAGPPERGGRPNWQDVNRGLPSRRSWDNEDRLPEWATENPLESGGSFDDRGAFHGSDEEQLEIRGGSKKEGLQKSTSQQHISQKTQIPLPFSKSTMSLIKTPEVDKNKESIQIPSFEDKPLSVKNSEVPSKEAVPPEEPTNPSASEPERKPSKKPTSDKERAKPEAPPELHENVVPRLLPPPQTKAEDNEFEKLHEDFVSKLVGVEEEPLKPSQPPNAFDLSNLPPPPNLTIPGLDKWFYQDPQGQMQGPFTNVEMLEWFKAGYFGQDLKVRRQCDERFFLLGELIAMCGGANPFQANIRFPILKHDISKLPETDLMQYQYLSQLATYKQAQCRVVPDPWAGLAIQQQEFAAQRLMQQQQAQQNMQFLQQEQPPATNPLMHMISQMQQANKLPPSGLLEKQPAGMPGVMDPHLHMHVSNFLSLQSRLPGGLPTQIPAGLPGPVAGPLPSESIPSNLSGLQGPGLGTPGIPLPGIPSGLSSLGMNVPRSTAVEHNNGQKTDPITSLLKQLQQQKQNQVESLWPQNQFPSNNAAPSPPQQWLEPNQEAPLSLWEMQQPSKGPTQTSQPDQKQPESSPKKQPDMPPLTDKEKPKKPDKSKEAAKQKEDDKELKKKKKAEEEQQKKEAEEKRKQEQRKLEMEKKAEAEKKKKEEERIKKELEKAKREAEEKRQRELEEKRKLKELRKLEEEARKKAEEQKKTEEDRIQKEKEQREREERQRAEERRQEQISVSKSAPWSQANSNTGLSLAEIQKAEKEKKAQEAALQAQRAQLEKEMKLQQQQQLEKAGNHQLGWAKKVLDPRKVKSLAEIQAEEHERLTKEATEARLKKEKEARETTQLPTTNSIWSGLALNWASGVSATNSQWSSSSNISGFWDEPAQKPQPSKPSTVSKSSSMSTLNNSTSKQQAPAPKLQKPKVKKEETASKKNNHNNNIDDEFTNWCYKTLENISTNVDIPTFVSFLRDIESAFDVREYCKEYLGENNMTQQFANSFLEKRRLFKSRESHKDDMCSPAPAITPAHHSTEFQEVKGKNKKSKKSKMLKVDSRILGFNVTSAPDRINVGDRDYGDNS